MGPRQRNWNWKLVETSRSYGLPYKACLVVHVVGLYDFLFIPSHLIRRVTSTQMEGASSRVARLPLFVPGQAVSHGAGLDEYADSVTMFHQSIFVCILL